MNNKTVWKKKEVKFDNNSSARTPGQIISVLFISIQLYFLFRLFSLEN